MQLPALNNLRHTYEANSRNMCLPRMICCLLLKENTWWQSTHIVIEAACNCVQLQYTTVAYYSCVLQL